MLLSVLKTLGGLIINRQYLILWILFSALVKPRYTLTLYQLLQSKP